LCDGEEYCDCFGLYFEWEDFVYGEVGCVCVGGGEEEDDVLVDGLCDCVEYVCVEGLCGDGE